MKNTPLPLVRKLSALDKLLSLTADVFYGRPQTTYKKLSKVVETVKHPKSFFGYLLIMSKKCTPKNRKQNKM